MEKETGGLGTVWELCPIHSCFMVSMQELVVDERATLAATWHYTSCFISVFALITALSVWLLAAFPHSHANSSRTWTS